jgi:hypothetical protein
MFHILKKNQTVSHTDRKVKGKGTGDDSTRCLEGMELRIDLVAAGRN